MGSTFCLKNSDLNNEINLGKDPTMQFKKKNELTKTHNKEGNQENRKEKEKRDLISGL